VDDVVVEERERAYWSRRTSSRDMDFAFLRTRSSSSRCSWNFDCMMDDVACMYGAFAQEYEFGFKGFGFGGLGLLFGGRKAKIEAGRASFMGLLEVELMRSRQKSWARKAGIGSCCIQGWRRRFEFR